MSVEPLDVERIAQLACFTLDDREIERLTEEMSRILDHATTLRELSGDGPELAAADRGITRSDGTRRDDAEDPDRLEAGIATFAPRVIEGFFVVPPPPGVVSGGSGESDDLRR